MSTQQVEAFREKINSDPTLQKQATQAFNTGLAELVALGAANGYHFTDAEASKAIDEHTRDGELSDYELELVSAGSSSGDNSNGGQGSNGKS